MQDRTVQLAERTPTPSRATTTQANEALRRAQTADGLVDLLVDFHTALGPNCQPLHKVAVGTTVTADITVQQLHAARGGRARGILTASGGRAIFTIDVDSYAHLAGILTTGTRATVRGTVTLIGTTKTISVRSARTAVTV